MIEVRAATTNDQAFISAMQFEALFVAPGAEPWPESIVDEPHLARYHAEFGHRVGDVGRIAVADGEPVGAAWVRLVRGYGYVDDETPELGIAVVSGRRGSGVGTALLTSLLDEVPRISLSVDARNPARALYERLGFALVRDDGEGSVVMLRAG